MRPATGGSDARCFGLPEFDVGADVVCAELKLDPRECRERLRAAVRDAKKFPELAKTHKSRTPWQWVKGSAGEKEARVAILS